MLEWQQSAADALVTLARQAATARRRAAQPHHVIVHLSDDAPPLLEGAGPISPETAERLTCDARRLTIKPQGRDLVHSRVGRCASYAQQRALHKRSRHCQYPGCTAARELEAHHLIPVEHGGATELDNLILLCPRHHKLLHDHHIRTSGTGEQPAFEDAGRTRDHHQPATRTTPLAARRGLPELEPGAFGIDRPSEAPVFRLLQLVDRLDEDSPARRFSRSRLESVIRISELLAPMRGIRTLRLPSACFRRRWSHGGTRSASLARAPKFLRLGAAYGFAGGLSRRRSTTRSLCDYLAGASSTSLAPSRLRSWPPTSCA